MLLADGPLERLALAVLALPAFEPITPDQPDPASDWDRAFSTSPPTIPSPASSSSSSDPSTPFHDALGLIHSTESSVSHPAPRSSAPKKTRKAKNADPDQPGRPLNKFMIFRSAIAQKIKSSGFKLHNSVISKIAGKAWARLPADEKQWYADVADEVKRRHRELYPQYRFQPKRRTQERKKRNVKHRTAAEKQSLEHVAECLVQGMSGEEIEAAMNSFLPDVDVEMELEDLERENDRDNFASYREPPRDTSSSPMAAPFEVGFMDGAHPPDTQRHKLDFAQVFSAPVPLSALALPMPQLPNVSLDGHLCAFVST